jgi:hypothetical protein
MTYKSKADRLAGLTVDEAQAISDKSESAMFNTVYELAQIKDGQEISKYLGFGLEFKDYIILCGLLKNSYLTDEQLGLLSDKIGARNVIDGLIVSSQFVQEQTILDILNEKSSILTISAIAFRLDLSDKIVFKLSQLLTPMVKEILNNNASLTQEQRIVVALAG